MGHVAKARKNGHCTSSSNTSWGNPKTLGILLEVLNTGTDINIPKLWEFFNSYSRSVAWLHFWYICYMYDIKCPILFVCCAETPSFTQCFVVDLQPFRLVLFTRSLAAGLFTALPMVQGCCQLCWWLLWQGNSMLWIWLETCNSLHI